MQPELGNEFYLEGPPRGHCLCASSASGAKKLYGDAAQSWLRVPAPVMRKRTGHPVLVSFIISLHPSPCLHFRFAPPWLGFIGRIEPMLWRPCRDTVHVNVAVPKDVVHSLVRSLPWGKHNWPNYFLTFYCEHHLAPSKSDCSGLCFSSFAIFALDPLI